jgi:hypothetical protein
MVVITLGFTETPPTSILITQLIFKIQTQPTISLMAVHHISMIIQQAFHSTIILIIHSTQPIHL